MNDSASDPTDLREPAHTTPRWVKVAGAVALVVVLAIGVMLLVGGGSHGPGRHTSSGGAGQSQPSSGSGIGGAGGHTPPAGGHTP